MSCTVHVEGSVTFIRTGKLTGSDDPDDSVPEPLVPPKATTPPPATSSEPEVLEPLVRGKAKLRHDLTSASVTAGCQAACSITAQAFPGGAHASARPRALATARVTLSTAGSRKVSLRLGAAARRAIRRAHGLRIVVTATPQAGGMPVVRSLSLRVR